MVRWLLAVPFLAFGLLALGLNLGVAAGFIRDCFRSGRFRRRSGLPFLGPVLLSLGLWAAPRPIPSWLCLLPWGLDGAALLIGAAVQRATGSRPA